MMETVVLEVPGPLDLVRTLGPLIPPSPLVGWARPERGMRAMQTPDGPATLAVALRDGEIEAEAWGGGARWVLDRVPDLLGFGDDPSNFRPEHQLLRDLHLRALGARFGKTGRVIEALVPTILGQRVTTRESHRGYRRLVTKLGEPAPGPGDLKLPPSAQALADLPYYEYHPLGIERKRADIIRAVCRRADRLEEIVGMKPASRTGRLLAFDGIGPWTAAFVMAIACGDPDAVPVGDYHLPNTVAWALAREPRAGDARMLELLEPYRGHRGRVIRLLKQAGIHAPKYGPRHAIRTFEST